MLKRLHVRNFKILFSFYRFLDKNGDKKISPKDANLLFESLDKNYDKWLDESEMNEETDKIFTELCSETAKVDRQGWLAYTASKKTSKKNFLNLLDKDGDSKLVYNEFRQIYAEIDTNKNKRAERYYQQIK